MGDRGHVHVEPGDGSGGVFFYAHWRGTSLPEVVASALDRGRARWNDPPYLARIIFSELIVGSVLDETGYGISAQPTDTGDGFRVVHVNVEGGVVALERAGEATKAFTFDEFVSTRPGW